MSQLKTNAIRHTTATSDAITLVSDGTATAKLTNTQPGSKNIIINGAQMIDQRHSGSSVTMSASATFITDRFKCWEDTDGGLTAQQTSDAPAGFKRSLKFTVTSADSSIGASQYAMLRYPVEGYDMEDQNWGTSSAGTLTLSFWVKCSVTGTFGGGFVNSSDNRSYPFTYTVSSADTWEKKTVTVAGDQTGTWNAGTSACVNIHWSLGIGSNSQGTAGEWQAGNKYTATGETALIANNGATWYLTGVQFERGTRATEFEYRSFSDEISRCERYYQNSFDYGSVPGTSTDFNDCIIVTSWEDGNAPGPRFRVEMRGAPTFTIRPRSSTSTGEVNNSDVIRTASTPQVSTKGASYVGVTSGQAGHFTAYTWEANAEI